MFFHAVFDYFYSELWLVRLINSTYPACLAGTVTSSLQKVLTFRHNETFNGMIACWCYMINLSISCRLYEGPSVGRSTKVLNKPMWATLRHEPCMTGNAFFLKKNWNSFWRYLTHSSVTNSQSWWYKKYFILFLSVLVLHVLLCFFRTY